MKLQPIDRTVRILFALSENERQLYFPDRQRLELPWKTLWFETKQTSASDWKTILHDFAPTILVSCWGTPPISDLTMGASGADLAYVCHTAGSVRAVVPREMIEDGLLVSNWGALASRQVAEHALLLILASLRRASHWRSSFDKTTFARDLKPQTRTLEGRRVGLHGFGKIARQLMDYLRPFGVEISVFSATVPHDIISQANAKPCGSIEELFSSSEILVECEALTPATTGSVTREVLGLLPDNAVFVNVGRGMVVDETALIDLAKTGRIQVALDVFADESKPLDSNLLLNPDAILSPHIGGPTGDLYPKCGEYALANIRAYLAGEEVSSVVNLDIYDRST